MTNSPEPDELTDNTNGIRILIVDDLKSARSILRKLLQGIGFKNIEESPDGEDAFQKLQESKFDLVISDWEMPKLKGLELLKKIRGETELSHLPFIMVTSTNNKDSVIEAINAGVSEYLAKPYGPELLESKIEAALIQKP